MKLHEIAIWLVPRVSDDISWFKRLSWRLMLITERVDILFISCSVSVRGMDWIGCVVVVVLLWSSSVLETPLLISSSDAQDVPWRFVGDFMFRVVVLLCLFVMLLLCCCVWGLSTSSAISRTRLALGVSRDAICCICSLILCSRLVSGDVGVWWCVVWEWSFSFVGLLVGMGVSLVVGV